MKALVWGVFFFLGAVWTGVVALFVALVRAAVGVLSSAGNGANPGEWSGKTPDIPLPDWLAPWLDLGGWQAWVQGAVALLDSLRTVLPTLGQVLDFLVPVAWIVWGLGIFGLLLLALIGSRLLSRFG